MKSSSRVLLILIPVFVAMIAAGVFIFFRPARERQIVKAPEFSYKLLNGKQVSLKDYRGKKPVIVNFWASWCPPCRAEAATLTKIANRYEGKVQFLGIAFQDQPDTAQKYIEEFKVPYPNGMDVNDAIGRKYKITGIPVTFFINIDGNVEARWIGEISEKKLNDYVEKML